MQNIYEKNLSALEKVDKGLYEKLKQIDKNEKYEVFIDEADASNINLIDLDMDYTPIYKEQPLEETLKLVSDYEKYKRYPYLYFFGLGNGVLYKILLENKTHQKILIAEPELEIIYIVLNLINFSEEIEEERIHIKHLEDITHNFLYEYIDTSAKIFAKVYDMLVPFEYYEKYKNEIIKLNSTIVELLQFLVYSFGNDIKDTLIGVEHFISNLSLTIKSPKLKDFLLNVKKTDTAVIVSTGPSLTKQIEKLKEIQDKVTIISVDASFPILYKNGIKPDIVTSIERIELTSTFYKNVPEDFHKDVVFAISNIAHNELIQSVKSKQKVFMSRPFGYIFFFELEDWGYAGRGMSAANMAYEIAAMARFEQIVFIGQDLSFAKEGNSHAKEHVLGSDEVKKNKIAGQLKAYGGEGVVDTTLVWKLFYDAFERDIRQTNTAGYSKTINATEGGARISGAIEMPFDKVIEEYIKNNDNKKLIRLPYPENKEVKKNQKKIEKKIKHAEKLGTEAKDIIESTFLEVVAFLEEVEKLKKDEKLKEVNYNRAAELIGKIDIVKEKVEDPIFHKIFFDVMQAYIMHLEIELAKIQVRHVESEDTKKVKMIEWLYAHKKWLFSVAGILDSTLEAIHRGKQNYFKSK